MTKPVYYFMTPYRPTFKDRVDVMPDGARTAFIHLKYLYPECSLLIEHDDQLYPLKCLRGPCHKNKNCMDILVRRVKYLFDEVVTDAGMIVAYYTWKDKPKTIRAGVFDKLLRNPRQIECRRSAFNKYRNEGDVFKWTPPSEFYMMGSTSSLISAKGLLYDTKG